MATSGYNEADTRAKLIDPALHARQWIELVKDEHRATHGEIHREQSAVRIELLNGNPLKRGHGRVDYLLCAYIEEHEQSLTLAFIEGKRQKLPPTQGLEQVKEYAGRHTVKFIYSILPDTRRFILVLQRLAHRGPSGPGLRCSVSAAGELPNSGQSEDGRNGEAASNVPKPELIWGQ